MPPDMPNESLYWGFKLYELLTLIGIITGPIIAVVITLITESRSQKRDRQIHVVRMLLNTRTMPSDPAYSVGINLIPVEFSKEKKVMKAWKDYIDTVMFTPTTENKTTHDTLLIAKQTALIYQMMKSLDFNLSETDIQTSAYIASGYISRDNLYLDSLLALREMANSMKEQSQFIRNSIPTTNDKT